MSHSRASREVCTLSWLPDPAGYWVFFNRDERRTRRPGRAPVRRRIGPVDAAERAAVTAELEAFDPGAVKPSVAVPLVFHDGLHAHLRLHLLGLLAARRSDGADLQRRGEALSELSVPHGAEVLAEQ